jgi:hypothetical protein
VAEGGYRFEPLQRGGLLLGLSAGQLGLLAGAVVASFVSVRALPGPLGWAAATLVLAVAGAGCRRVMGRSPLQWARVGASFLTRAKRVALPPPAATYGGQLLGQAAGAGPCSQGPQRLPSPKRAGAPQPGARGQWPRLPAKTLAPGVYLQQASLGPTGPLGVLVDERSGTAAALLRARGGPFCLLDDPAKEAAEAAWAGLLESVANQPSSLLRLQWCHRAVPVFGWPGAKGQEAARLSWRHETFLVLVTRVPLRRRPRRCEVPPEVAALLVNQAVALRGQLHAMGTACDGPLDARGCAGAIGASLVPGLERHPEAHPWPLSTQECWGEVRADGYWHRVYWVAEWPRSAVGPAFLSPLLVARAQRCMSVVMAPVPPEKAARDAESSRTAQLADARLRAQGGFLETARQRRQAEAVEGREAGLADGYGAYRFAGYLAVSGRTKAELERGCEELEAAAGSARLCVRPLYGQQKEALSWALPFGRGI